MVRAVEGTGDLARAFEQLYKVLSRGEAFRKQVRSAMIYPAFLGGFCLLVITGLFVFVIPAMKELLEGRALHPITQTVLRMSGWHWSVWVSGIVGTVGVVFMIKRLCPWQQWALKIPICKTLVTEGVLLRFSRVFSVLLSSGVSIVEALKLARSVMHHPTFERAIAEAEEGIVEGRKLSEALKKSGLFPPLMVRMLATAEETGRPQEMLDHIADLYEGELEQTLVQFTNLLQPVMLLVLGGIVGLILLSVLLPLTDVSTLL